MGLSGERCRLFGDDSARHARPEPLSCGDDRLDHSWFAATTELSLDAKPASAARPPSHPDPAPRLHHHASLICELGEIQIQLRSAPLRHSRRGCWVVDRPDRTKTYKSGLRIVVLVLSLFPHSHHSAFQANSILSELISPKVL